MSRWNVVTETEVNLPNDAIPFVMTNRDRDTAAIIRCDIEAMRRRFREPEGLTVTDATQADFDEARRVLVL